MVAGKTELAVNRLLEKLNQTLDADGSLHDSNSGHDGLEPAVSCVTAGALANELRPS